MTVVPESELLQQNLVVGFNLKILEFAMWIREFFSTDFFSL